MKFALSAEHRAFSESLHDLLDAADTPAVIRAWADGKREPGLALWGRLAELGVTGLAVPETHGGFGADAVDLAVAFEALGYHAVPGPLVESVAVAPMLLTGGLAERRLPALASGASIGTVAIAPHAPWLLDADIAHLRVVVADDQLIEISAAPGDPLSSVDRARRLFPVSTDGTAHGEVSAETRARALNYGAFAVSAQLLGAGRWLLDTSVAYAKQRVQYGHPIGEYQAIKHLLADVATRLEFATPLVHGAAVALAGDESTSRRDVSAARVATADAAYLAARTALQVHGAIGYTAEHDLGLWLTKVRALQSAWGTQATHRAQVLDALRSSRKAG